MNRVVRFGDTDAAGVMHFLQLFRWCHEAWEESLEIYGLEASSIFPQTNFQKDDAKDLIGLPIVHCHADFLRPLHNGDYVDIELRPEKLERGRFQIEFNFKKNNTKVAKGLIRHQAINSHTRKCCLLPDEITLWLEASSVTRGITTCN